MVKGYKRGRNVTEQEFNRVKAYLSLPDIRLVDAMKAYKRNVDTVQRIQEAEDWPDYQSLLAKIRIRLTQKKQVNGETPQPVKSTDPIISELAQIKELLISIDGTLSTVLSF